MTREFPLQRLPGAHLTGVPTAAMSMSGIVDPFVGRTNLASGSATVTVSTALVQSDSLILMGAQATTNQASGFGQPIEVKSINPGVAIVFGTAEGVALARDTTIMWLLWRT